ncbi:hypothetical protein [Sporisorium scitamineum]|uniref:Uncharacterized protein n=1 Tax=Sporisorium scitamineum TaxID=49012 RepID=A0A0F7SC83_9BASI|nr:hypothetical protein [Sporisorium scitamineum]
MATQPSQHRQSILVAHLTSAGGGDENCCTQSGPLPRVL